MPEIQLTPEMLRSEATKLNSKKEELTEEVKNIQGFVEKLQEGWHGKTQQAFVNSFNEKKSVYDKFAEDMGTFVAFMQGYASSMEQADASAPSGLNF